MSFLLKFSIHRQIQIGMCGIATCIWLLIFLMISINSYVLINLFYSEIKQGIYELENNYINKILFTLESELKIEQEVRVNSFQNVRGFLETYKRNSDFLNIYTNLDIDKSIINYSNESAIISQNCTLNTLSCLMFSNYSIIPDNKQKDFDNYKKVLKINLPILRFIWSFSTYDNDRIYDFFNIFSSKFDSVFVYPYSKQNLKFNKENMVNNINYQLSFMETRRSYHMAFINSLNITGSNTQNTIQPIIANQTKVNPINLTKTLQNFKTSPYLIMAKQANFSRPETLSFSNDIYNYDTSFLFNSESDIITSIGSKSDNITTSQLLKIENIDDVLIGDWSKYGLLDDYLKKFNKRFKEFEILVTDVNDINLKLQKCLYFLKFYEIDEYYTNYTTVSQNSFQEIYNITELSQIYKCFQGFSKIQMEKYFKGSTINRMIKINFFDKLNIQYKIIKKHSPSLANSILVKAIYKDYVDYNFFSFYNMEYNSDIQDKVYYHFYTKLFQIMAANLFIWMIIMIAIILILTRLASNISSPIKKLVNAINSIGSNKQESKLSNSQNEGVFDSIDDISYPQDKDINDMFQICKTLIKGAFNQTKQAESDSYIDKLDKQYKYLSHAYNNISYIKSNNFIIEEDILEKACDNQSSIFSFNLNETNKHGDEKQLIELIRKNYYISTEKEGVDCILEQDRENMLDLVEKYNVDYESHPFFDYYQSSNLRILSI